MGSYSDGFNDSVGALIVTPQDVLNEMRSVDTEILSLGADIHSQSGNITPAFLEAWQVFEKEWRAFYEENKGWFARAIGVAVSAGVYDKTREFANRVSRWRQRFIEEGGSLTGPGPSKPWTETLADAFKVGAVIAGIGVVAYGLSQVVALVQEGRSTVKELRGK